MKTIKTVIICGVFCTVLLTFGPNSLATSFTIGDTNELGFVNPGIPAGDADLPLYINNILSLPLGGTGSVTIGPKTNITTRSFNIFSPLDPAVYVSRTTFSDYNGPATLTLDLGTGYEYLLVKYDGPNFGSEVWYIGGLTSVTIPAYGSGTQYGISLAALFTPLDNGGNNEGVPDGGITVALLGVALTGLAGLRTKLRKH